MKTEGRHPSTIRYVQLLRTDHLRSEELRQLSDLYLNVAVRTVGTLDDGPGLTSALHRIWEAKNEAVAELALQIERRDGQRPVSSVPPEQMAGFRAMTAEEEGRQ